MFSKLSVFFLAALAAATAAAPSAEPEARAPAPLCACPAGGKLVFTSPAVQCAYPHGACTWDANGWLLNTHQTNCPIWAFPGTCANPDKDHGKGVLINHLFAYTCSYAGPKFGACTWDATGALVGFSAPFCQKNVTPCVHNK